MKKENLFQVWTFRLTLLTCLFLTLNMLILSFSCPVSPDLLNLHLFCYVFLWKE